MRDPRVILSQARSGPVPWDWRVFTKKRGTIGGFIRRTSNDPDPLLVLTPEGVVEYIDEKKPLIVIDFYNLLGISLQVRGSSSSDSMHVRLDVWVDLQYLNGTKEKWRPSSFQDNMQVIQYFVESYGAHKALRRVGYI
jgi:hypothetical protein